MPAPSPPKVHAPDRVSSDDVQAATTPQTQVTSGSPVAASSSQGARVTAAVGEAQSPPMTVVPGGPSSSTPSTATPSTATPAAGGPGGGLARTGSDIGLVLTFALLAVLLGVLLVRLGSCRDRPSTPS